MHMHEKHEEHAVLPWLWRWMQLRGAAMDAADGCN